MLEILYFIGIFPIQTLLESILSLFYILTQSYGLSLILLSFSIQIFLFKLLSFFEHKSQAFNALKQSVNNKREEFKRVFKGAELMSYTQILYKQRGFHPLFALFSLGGLALQIPLFIALIILVNEAEFLKGVGFLWINDLSKPDMIMSMSSMGLNTQEFHTFTLFQHPIAFHLLPFMMCMLSLGSVWIYAQDRGQVIQGIGISLLFFVLLYNMPSALVLYWSSNMLFTLLKGLWWRVRESKQRENNEQEGVENQKENREKKEVQYQEGRKHNHQSIDVSQEGLPSTSKPQSQFSKVWRNIFTPHNKLKAGEYKAYKHISILAIVNICFMICVFSPFAVYSSDVSQFDPTQTYQTLGALFGVFILSSLLLIYLTSFFYKSRLLKLGAYGVSVILLIGVVYTFVLTGDYAGNSYGTLENFVFQGGAPVYGAMNKWFDLLYIGLVAILCLMLFCFVSASKIYKTISAINIFLLCYGGFYTAKIHFSIQHQQMFNTISNPPSYSDELLSFSKEQNILVLILDAFTGSHFGIMLKHDQDLKHVFSGFTYYDNTLASSNNTQFNTPAILGGHQYTSLSLIQKGVKYPEKHYLKAFSILPNALQENGWNVALYGVDPIEPKDLRKMLEKDGGDLQGTIVADSERESYVGAYIKHYQLSSYIQARAQKYRQKYNSVGTLLAMGLFRASLYSIRSRIYVDDRWIFAKTNPIDDFFTQVKYISDIAMFPYLSNTNSTRKTFKYIKTLGTHFPWYLDKNCLPNLDASTLLPALYLKLTPKEYINAYNNNHYNNELCTIGWVKEWITWLKEQGIYDKSTIIIASDHGHYDSFDQIANNNNEQLGKQSDALLLIKQATKNAIPLKVSHQLMSNADIHSFICAFTQTPCEDKMPSNNQKRVLYHSNSPFEKTLKIERAFAVENGIYNPKNWKEITKEIVNEDDVLK